MSGAPDSGGESTIEGLEVYDPPLAPIDFVLPDADGVMFALAEQRGSWVVVHLYPRTDTPDCACDATVFTEHLWRFGSLDALVVCVTSSDVAEAAHFAKKYGLSMPLLSDPTFEFVRRVRAFDETSADPVVRTTLIVGPSGGLRGRFDRVTDERHVESIIAALRWFTSGRL